MSSANVSDHRSNSYEQIEFAWKKIGKSEARLNVFDCIYHGKKPVKTVQEISLKTGLSAKRVTEVAKVLANNSIIKQIKLNKQTAYAKDAFYAANKNEIIRLVKNPKKIKDLPSKRNKVTSQPTEKIIIPRNASKIKQLFIDDVDSFKKVRKVKVVEMDLSKISEDNFKKGIQKIIGERGTFTDWGGESNDLLTTRVILKGNRIQTAFAFKGPGKKGKLVPGKMGKNGDQIQRLFKSPANLFVLQYWGDIDGSVYEQMEAFAKIQSAAQKKLINYCVIDGQDTLRLVSAYLSSFQTRNTKK